MADADNTLNPSADNVAKTTCRKPMCEVDSQCWYIDRLALLSQWVLDVIDDDQHFDRVEMLRWLSDQITSRTHAIRELVKDRAAAEQAQLWEAVNG